MKVVINFKSFCSLNRVNNYCRLANTFYSDSLQLSTCPFVKRKIEKTNLWNYLLKLMKLVKSLSMVFNLKSKPSFRLPLINYLYAANCLISSNFSAKRINRPKPTKIHSWQMISISKRSYVNKMRTYEQIFGVWGHFTKVLLIKSWGYLLFITQNLKFGLV